jgi:hypothetical protein
MKANEAATTVAKNETEVFDVEKNAIGVKQHDKKGATAKAKARPAYLTFLGDLIEKGKMTQKQLQEEGWKEFPALAKSTITTVLVDSKNPKYSRFGKVAKKDEKTGCLHF